VSLAGDIFQYLLEVGRASATQIANATGHARTAVSKALSDSRFVSLGKDGRYMMYGVRQSERPEGEPVRGPQQQELV
jgi:hypothetical protein